VGFGHIFSDSVVRAPAVQPLALRVWPIALNSNQASIVLGVSNLLRMEKKCSLGDCGIKFPSIDQAKWLARC
jgi:hypothetical protein